MVRDDTFLYHRRILRPSYTVPKAIGVFPPIKWLSSFSNTFISLAKCWKNFSHQSVWSQVTLSNIFIKTPIDTGNWYKFHENVSFCAIPIDRHMEQSHLCNAYLRIGPFFNFLNGISSRKTAQQM